MQRHPATDIVWAPQPGSQALFLTCPYFEVLYAGTRGPGKTDALLMDFAQHIGRGYGDHWRGVLFRRTYPELVDVIAKSKRWFFRIWERGVEVDYNAQSHTWKWATGEELLLRNFATPDDYWSYHGHEYPWIGWEELTNWANADCYNAMKACSRSSFPGMPRRYRASANPYGRGHNWVKRYFIDGAEAGIPQRGADGLTKLWLRGHWSENRIMLDADPDYVSKLAADINPHRRKAWLDGSWDIQAGGMFDDLWDKAVHVLPEFPIPAGWYVDRAHDWGSSKPFCTLWFAEANGEAVEMPGGGTRWFPRGSVIVIAEDYGGDHNKGLGLVSREIAKRNVDAERLVGERLGFLGRVKDGPGDVPDTLDGTSPRDEMAKAGMRWLPVEKRKGSRAAGWEMMRTRLAAAKAGNVEQPHLYVFSTCRHLIRTIVDAPRDEKNPDDIDTDSEDHALDCTRYRLLAERPQEVGFLRSAI